jgi:ketosteroid isomerase-like protein
VNSLVAPAPLPAFVLGTLRTGPPMVSGRQLSIVQHSGPSYGCVMKMHPNMALAQSAWEAVAKGDYRLAFDALADEVIMENGPGAGPWHRARGKDDVALLLLEFGGHFGETFRQDGSCVFADDRMAICLVHETGTSQSGDPFDNMAVYVSRLRPDGLTDRIWTTDLDSEHCEDFWRANPGSPSKYFD